jgi:hypothetical protein
MMSTRALSLLLVNAVAIVPFTLFIFWTFSGFRIRGYSLRIGRLRWLQLFGVQYTYQPPRHDKPSSSVNLDHAHVRFQLPLPSDPRWCTITLDRLTFEAPDCKGSATNTTFTLLLFPHAFGFSAGPWIRFSTDDAAFTVNSSQHIPDLIVPVRNNIVATLLTGEIIRCEYFRTKVRFAPVGSALTTHAAERSDEAAPLGQDEMAVQMSFRGYHVANWQERIYTFGAAEWVLRKSWIAQRGALWLSVEDARWTQLPAAWQRMGGPVWPPSQILFSLLQLPYGVATFFRDPSMHVDVHLKRLNVAFDDFRLRDAEVLRQAAVVAQQRLGKEFRGGGLLKDLMWNLAAWIVAP